jgi:hypothetical protein
MSKKLFDELPTDMIYYEIFPYLDYNSRVIANLLLPRKDRLRTPLRKDAVLEFALRFGSTILTSFVKKQGITRNPIARNRLTLKIWRTVPLFPELFQYNSRLREVMSAKAAEFCDLPIDELAHVTPYTRKELKRLCEAFLLSLETSYPYKRKLSLSSSSENWSAVRA